MSGRTFSFEVNRTSRVFTPNALGGTDLRWRGSFTEGIPGTGPVMRAILHGAIKFFSARLVKVAEAGR